MEFCSFSHYHFISFHFRRLCFCLFSSFLNWKLLTILIDHAHIFSTNKLARTHANPQQQTDDPIESSGKSVVQKKNGTAYGLPYLLLFMRHSRWKNEKRAEKKETKNANHVQISKWLFRICHSSISVAIVIVFPSFYFLFYFFFGSHNHSCKFCQNKRSMNKILFVFDWQFLVCAHVCVGGCGLDMPIIKSQWIQML